MIPMHRRQFLAALAAGAFLTQPAFAQDDYPGKGPIKVIVPLPAGGAADASARIVVAAMQAQMKQTFVVENKPGASFLLGMQAMAQAPADGYTIMHLNTGMAAVQASLKKYDMLKSLAPISLMGTMPAVLAVPASSPAKSVRDLVEAGRAKPGSLDYGSVGIGSLEHLWVSSFSKQQGFQAVHIPFKGMPEASTALASGEVKFIPLVMAVALPMIQKGMIRPLAVLDTQRHPALADVPTLKEAGLDAPPLAFWGGFAAPAGTPPAVVEKLRQAIAAAVATPDVKAKLVGIGTTTVASDKPQAFQDLIANELSWMGQAVQGANLQLN